MSKAEEHLERLSAMIVPGQSTWDLSANDVAAITWAVEQIDGIAERSDDAAVAANYAMLARDGRPKP